MKAWQLIQRPENWCRHASARAAAGNAVNSDDPTAVQWCAVGAIWRIYGYNTTEGTEVTMRLGRNLKNCGSIGHWNDTSDHAEIVRVLRELDI